jgi:hypothetical protein
MTRFPRHRKQFRPVLVEKLGRVCRILVGLKSQEIDSGLQIFSLPKQPRFEGANGVALFK